jgi:hypothetical protein
MRISIRLAAACAAVVLAACSHKTTVATGNGETVTTDSSNQSVTVQSSDGTVTVGKSADPAQLGVPIYPGAGTTSADASVQVSGAHPGQMASFTTTDDFDKVYEFYKAHMPAGSEKMKMDAGGTSMAEFQATASDGTATTVTVSGKDGKTSILIVHGKND